MLKKENRLTKRKEFGYIYRNGKYSATDHLSIIYVPTKLKNARIGFSVSKKLGKAVVRNKVKRQLRDIVRNMIDEINPCFNYIVVAKPNIVDIDYWSMKKEIEHALNKANLKK